MQDDGRLPDNRIPYSRIKSLPAYVPEKEYRLYEMMCLFHSSGDSHDLSETSPELRTYVLSASTIRFPSSLISAAIPVMNCPFCSNETSLPSRKDCSLYAAINAGSCRRSAHDMARCQKILVEIRTVQRTCGLFDVIRKRLCIDIDADARNDAKQPAFAVTRCFA